MDDLVERTTTFFVNRVAPSLLRRHPDIDPSRRARLEREAQRELFLQVSRGRPDPEEFAPPPAVLLSPELRAVAVQMSVVSPAPLDRLTRRRSLDRVGHGVHVEDPGLRP